jgi:hypothetical protein
MNVLIELDGELETMQFFVDQGGFDSGILNGQFPETIVVGVPVPLNGTACPDALDNSCQQRAYEYTNTVCDPAVAICTANQITGGGNLTLDFIWDTVLPAVMTELGLSMGEVCMCMCVPCHGESL